MTPDFITALLLLTVSATGSFGLALYSVLTPWWRSRAGRAYFALFTSLVVFAWHFVLEAVIGQSPPWVEMLLLSFVLAAIIFNIITASRKQLLGYRRRKNQ